MITDKNIHLPVSVEDAPHSTMCILPFIHLHTWPAGQVFPCCVYDWHADIPQLPKHVKQVPEGGYSGIATGTSLEDIWNDEKIKTLRKQLVEGEEPAGCRRCFQGERQGVHSFRLARNYRYKHHMDIVHKAVANDYKIEDFNLYYWDFRNTNLCNMTCRTCGPELSSKWHEDYKAITGLYHHAERNGLFEATGSSLQDIYDVIDRNIDIVEHVYFAGGEPLINDMHYYILNKLIEHERFDCEISYNTNLLHLKYKKYDLIDIWNKFNKVDVMASLDAIGPRAEYLRHGTKWPKIEENIKTLLQNKKIGFNVTPVISLFNVLHMPDYIDYMLDIGLESWQIYMGNILLDPESYHVAMLPDHIKTQVRELYVKYLENKKEQGYGDRTIQSLREKFDAILNFFDVDIGDDVLRKKYAKQFIHLTGTLDRVRNENFVDTYPELKDYWDACIPFKDYNG